MAAGQAFLFIDLVQETLLRAKGGFRHRVPPADS